MPHSPSTPTIPRVPVLDLPLCPSTHCYEWPPTDQNPRNSEGAFLPLTDGRLLFVWSYFESTDPSDDADASIYGMTSGDKGRTWSEPTRLIGREADGATNVMSLSLLRMDDGAVGLFYFLRRAKDDGRLWLRRSDDEGQTWSEPVPCTTGKGYYVTNNDRVVRLSSGRLIAPAAYHRVRHARDGSEFWDGRSSAYFFYSDDDGNTWDESNPCTFNAPATRTGLQEPGVIELASGALYGWARTDMGCQYEMISNDNGLTWSEAVPSRFSGPCGPLSMKRDHKGRKIAIWNPIPEYVGRPKVADFWHGGRTPLVIAVGYDDGTWTQPHVLEAEPDAGYCYTAIHADDEGLLLAYCAGQKSLGDGSTLMRMRMRRVAQADLDQMAAGPRTARW